MQLLDLLTNCDRIYNVIYTAALTAYSERGVAGTQVHKRGKETGTQIYSANITQHLTALVYSIHTMCGYYSIILLFGLNFE